MSPPSYGLGLLQASVALAGICLLLYVTLRFARSRGLGVASANRSMRVLERLPLDVRRSLFLVEIEGRRFVLSAGDGGAPRLIVALDPPDVREGDGEGGGAHEAARFRELLARSRPSAK